MENPRGEEKKSLKTLGGKLDYLQSNHFGEWLSMRQKVNNEISDGQSIFCLCGRLATGLHENGCRKLQNAVTKETVKRLASFLPPQLIKE